MTASYHLDAWGQYRFPGELNASANRFGFTGYIFDRETDLYYARARYFDSEYGRFTTQDSVLGRTEDPPSLHRYTYGHNRPTFYVDPDGHEVFLANDTETGRRKALYSITPNLKAKEQRNLHYVETDDGRVQLKLRDPNLIDPESASPAYRHLRGRIMREDLDINYTIVEEGRTAIGRYGEIHEHEQMTTGQTDIFTEGPELIMTGEADVFVPEGREKLGVMALSESGREVPVEQPTHILAAHELLGETALIERGQPVSRELEAGIVAIEIENEIRRDQGLAERTGSDHGLVFREEVEVVVEVSEEDEKQQ